MLTHYVARATANREYGLEGARTPLTVDFGGLDVLVNNAGITGPTVRVHDVIAEALDIRAVIKAEAQAAGISENEMTDRTVSTTHLRCFVTQQDIANMALYLASRFGATISG